MQSACSTFWPASWRLEPPVRQQVRRLQAAGAPDSRCVQFAGTTVRPARSTAWPARELPRWTRPPATCLLDELVHKRGLIEPGGLRGADVGGQGLVSAREPQDHLRHAEAAHLRRARWLASSPWHRWLVARCPLGLGPRHSIASASAAWRSSAGRRQASAAAAAVGPAPCLHRAGQRACSSAGRGHLLHKLAEHLVSLLQPLHQLLRQKP